jgi:hypothetical protein
MFLVVVCFLIHHQMMYQKNIFDLKQFIISKFVISFNYLYKYTELFYISKEITYKLLVVIPLSLPSDFFLIDK